MSPLAHRPFCKMNGIGNEIIVLDLRGSPLAVRPAEARAIGRGPGMQYDQLMVISDARSAASQAFVDIFNIDGSTAGACGNGTRCVAWVLLRGTERQDADARNRRGPARLHAQCRMGFHGRHGRAAARLERDSAA